ncbi:Cytochrome c551 peroxidase [Methylobacterium hispanicum]|jgi:cytochrome c peroxidase|uniref:Methylamine utilization protein MauG n=1 Tax=Methylobacterium hispanicum TaxID=270350 RepID=A0AAV4ZRY5_9HYPH|nr:MULTISPECIES: cytochrome c peroxidase [Methylobacterium]GJD91310.1 Cytochrome c551 peroxidase [Methylobacterium hispanicum]
MAWKVGAAVSAALAVGIAGSAAQQAPQRAAWRAEYRAPESIPFPESNPYSRPKAELGRRLFFDPVLSGDRTRSCASCHQPDLAWADGRRRALGRSGDDMEFHTPSLLNLAWQEGRFGWDGKFRDLEAVAFGPISAPGNMNLGAEEAVRRLAADPAYAAAFAGAFPNASPDASLDPGPAVTRERIEAALATFERLIVSTPAPFDRWIAGDERAVPEAAKRGFDLFNGRANCAACHGGWSFSDGSFHDIGVGRGEDIGRGRFVPKSEALRYAFKTPGLREMRGRTHFMHDGSLDSLAAVIDLYDRGGIDRPSRSREIRPLNLTAAEKADLLAFLDTLNADAALSVAAADLPDGPPKP